MFAHTSGTPETHLITKEGSALEWGHFPQAAGSSGNCGLCKQKRFYRRLPDRADENELERANQADGFRGDGVTVKPSRVYKEPRKFSRGPLGIKLKIV